MTPTSEGYEAVIGLEIHVQLLTEQKLFCPDATRFGEAPNTHVCPVCLGLPGALPILNRDAVELAIRTALALDCTVNHRSVWARKNYFYPDLPKGYQISQFEEPLASGGRFEARGREGEPVVARLRRIHMEEDAGKSIHDRIPDATAVDLNRTGTPLVEVVTEPDFRAPAQVRDWLTGLKQLLEYLEVSDCNMEEGSLRVDANVSIRPAGAETLGTKTELKNMNSFSGVEKALAAEIRRQEGRLEEGRPVEHQTLLWDERTGDLRPLRSKEESRDYRYFPDPDLPPLEVEPQWIEAVLAELPELPARRHRRFVEEYGLPDYDAGVLTATRSLADYFEATAAELGRPKEASNWVMGPAQAAMNELGLDAASFPVSPGTLARLIRLVDEGTINRGAARKVLDRLLAHASEAPDAPAADPAALVEEMGLAQVSDADRIDAWVDDALTSHPQEVERYRGGEKRLRGFFMGEVMKRSRGKADPQEVARRLGARLDQG
jgi:aspartyl-tRNA(Asn)/glutamyl-tRNA(Gln) amidotransferase subunit B